jgi:tRNA (cmo5U34)-methyltransferase
MQDGVPTRLKGDRRQHLSKGASAIRRGHSVTTSAAPALDFSFANFANGFEEHINHSIRGYADLRDDCVAFSQYFIENDSAVLDLGCSSGALLRRVRDHNQKNVPKVHYIGLEIEKSFKEQWRAHRAPNVSFATRDMREYDRYANLSFVTSLFALQFMQERDRLSVVKRVYEGLIEGGAFILAEKVHSKSAKIQDMLTFMYYDHKRKAFTEKEILDKERSLRDKMKLWSEYKLIEMLRSSGFNLNYLQIFWRNHNFIGIIAVKAATYR